MRFLDSPTVRLDLDDATGAVVQPADRAWSRLYLEGGAAAPPFRLHTEEGVVEEFTAFTWSQTDGGVTLNWSVNPQVTVGARWRLSADGRSLQVTCKLDNRSDAAFVGLAYPVLGTFRPISPGGDQDRLVHSYATGFLVRNPVQNLASDAPGLRYMPYSEGFAGSTTQSMAFYATSGGGVYVACLDGDFNGKWLNVRKSDDAHLEMSVIHGNEAVAPRTGFGTPYVTEISFLQDGTWYEAAERYRAWAIDQPWCARGWIADRPAGGAVRSDRGVHVRHRRPVRPRPLDQAVPEGREIPVPARPRARLAPSTPRLRPLGGSGPTDDWFPAAFSRANLQAIREQGDLVTAFEFDYLFPPEKAGAPEIKRAFQEIPAPFLGDGAYRFPFLCPTESYADELHVERNARLVEEERVDGVYYDISANNIIRICNNPEHAHPRGAARALTLAYRRTYRRTREAMQRAAGAYPLLGTEMISEVFVDLVDFYQARAGAQPAAAFEGGPLRELLKRGDAELVPLFAFLYHEYGPVRLDGWGKLTRESGELFYCNVARIYLWGGLFEINSEFSPMEVVDGVENPPSEHYADIVPRGYPFCEEMAQYVGRWARLRTGAGRPYLAYGRMLRPPALSVLERGPDGHVRPAPVPDVRLDWFSYNCPAPWKEYEDRGVLAVPAIVASAWQARDGSTAILMCNVSTTPYSVSVAGIDAPLKLEPRLPTMVGPFPVSVHEPQGGTQPWHDQSSLHSF